MVAAELSYAKELEAARHRLKRLKESLAWRRKVCAGSFDTAEDLSGKPEEEPDAEEKSDEPAKNTGPIHKLVAERLLDPELELPCDAGSLQRQVQTCTQNAASCA